MVSGIYLNLRLLPASKSRTQCGTTPAPLAWAMEPADPDVVGDLHLPCSEVHRVVCQRADHRWSLMAVLSTGLRHAYDIGIEHHSAV